MDPAIENPFLDFPRELVESIIDFSLPKSSFPNCKTTWRLLKYASINCQFRFIVFSTPKFWETLYISHYGLSLVNFRPVLSGALAENDWFVARHLVNVSLCFSDLVDEDLILYFLENCPKMKYLSVQDSGDLCFPTLIEKFNEWWDERKLKFGFDDVDCLDVSKRLDWIRTKETASPFLQLEWLNILESMFGPDANDSAYTHVPFSSTDEYEMLIQLRSLLIEACPKFSILEPDICIVCNSNISNTASSCYYCGLMLQRVCDECNELEKFWMYCQRYWDQLMLDNSMTNSSGLGCQLKAHYGCITRQDGLDNGWYCNDCGIGYEAVLSDDST